MNENTSGLAEAYQLAARELRSLRSLSWNDLSPREDAPWLFAGGELRRLEDARGGVTIVDGYNGNPGVRRVTVALEWLHGRHGRRTVRLIALVDRTD